MNYGLYLASSGILTSMHRQDVLSNNLANVNTVAFKPDVPETRQRDVAGVEKGMAHLPSDRLLERLGAGVLMAPTRTSMAQGALEKTEGPLDLAIEGEGFFVVAADPRGAEQGIRLTRDGRMTIDGQGRLVLAGSGQPVLDAADRPVRLDPGAQVRIAPDGAVFQNDREVGRIQVVTVPNTSTLRKAGDNLFSATPGALAGRLPFEGRIVQGALERSAVDPIKTMMGISSASSGVSAGSRVVQIFDELMDRAINTFGRVA